MEYICIGMYLERYGTKAFFFVILEKFCHFFAFGVFGFVLVHKKAFSVTTKRA
ncbi:hypothetical protein [Helicobacter pylori]|uniref:hypothetical protein n=1 Tax=Helicobacter pylori TaxID=210 RepID=UPI0012B1643D|nr:hypothetical protein [Helicobacter pylori]